MSLVEAKSLVFPPDTPLEIEAKETLSEVATPQPPAEHESRAVKALERIASDFLEATVQTSKESEIKAEPPAPDASQPIEAPETVIKFPASIAIPLEELGHKDSQSGIYEPSDIQVRMLRLLARPEFYSSESNIAKEFRLLPTRLRYHLSELVKNGFLSGDHFHPVTDEREYLLTNKAKEFLNQPDYKVPHYQSPDLDEVSRKILTILARPHNYPSADDIAEELLLNPMHIEYRLGELETQGYVGHQSSFTRPNEYFLTLPGKKFVLENNLLPDNS